MRTVRILLVLLVLAVLPLNTAFASHGGDHHEGDHHGQPFVAVLLGQMEAPPVQTPANGASVVSLNQDETALTYFVAAHQFTSPVVASHIHCGAPGVAGPVVVPLFPRDNYPGGMQPTEMMPSGPFVIAGMAMEEGITPVPDSEACPGGISSFADLVAKMMAGETYVNVHTEQNPAGEIRGQLIPIQQSSPTPEVP